MCFCHVYTQNLQTITSFRNFLSTLILIKCFRMGTMTTFTKYKFYYLQIIKHPPPNNRRRSRVDLPTFCGENPILMSIHLWEGEEYIARNYYSLCPHDAIDWWALGIFLYEMLYGRTPFRGKNRQKSFANILHKDLTFPSSILVKASLAGRQLLNLLLNRDPVDRLESNSGANEIKQHPFFRGINWPLIRTMSPPPLDAPPELIEKDLKAKDVNWEDGVLVNPVDLDLF
ncbi:hypothetical protein Pint_33969 [Pistacia integerrima]|uniref:Uncharacterized protein n=1 Tax=Pistacia integerrima TaxID=434235 RepID=A0ACC0X5R1_9ROSI|nr:hypothetical protein Pint_33969 [Pistacia integerrima]